MSSFAYEFHRNRRLMLASTTTTTSAPPPPPPQTAPLSQDDKQQPGDDHDLYEYKPKLLYQQPSATATNHNSFVYLDAGFHSSITGGDNDTLDYEYADDDEYGAAYDNDDGDEWTTTSVAAANQLLFNHDDAQQTANDGRPPSPPPSNYGLATADPQQQSQPQSTAIIRQRRPSTPASLSPPAQQQQLPAATSPTDHRWFCAEPHRRTGLDRAADLRERCARAHLVRRLAGAVRASRLACATAITLMHRFHLYHGYVHFSGAEVARVALQLACKSEDHNGAIELAVHRRIRAASLALAGNAADDDSATAGGGGGPDTEEIMLLTLGFELTVRLPYVTVLGACERMRTGAAFRRQAAANVEWTLLTTAWSVRHAPELVAALCVYVTACQRGVSVQWPPGDDTRPWYQQMGADGCTLRQLEQMRWEMDESWRLVSGGGGGGGAVAVGGGGFGGGELGG